jgi:hypothetical protein
VRLALLGPSCQPASNTVELRNCIID